VSTLESPVRPRLLTAAQAAELLEVDPRTVSRLADIGKLPAIRLSEKSPRRYRREDVERLLQPTAREKP
jgi:excisionase family DNA binding protein